MKKLSVQEVAAFEGMSKEISVYFCELGEFWAVEGGERRGRGTCWVILPVSCVP